MVGQKQTLNTSFSKFTKCLGKGRMVMDQKNETVAELKGESNLRNMFVAFSVLLFAFFVLDISLTSVSVGQTLTSIINLIPLI